MNLIQTTFAMAALIRRDAKVRIGLRLGQSLAQISQTAMGPYSRERSAVLVAAVQSARDDGDLDQTIDPDAVGHLIWCGILGNYFLADAAGEDVITNLAKFWRVALRGIVAPRSESFFQNLVERVAAQYTRTADGHPDHRAPGPSAEFDRRSTQPMKGRRTTIR